MKNVAGLMALCVCLLGAYAQATETSIRVSEDVSVTYYYHINDPVSWHGNYFGQDVMSFWKFDISSLSVPPGNTIQINSASFVIHGESTYASTILPKPTQTIYETSSTWAPSFTTSNAPAFGTVLGSFDYPGGFISASVDCKNYLQATLNNSETLIAFGNDGPSTYIDATDIRILRFIAKGYGYNDHYAPRLDIDYTIVPEPMSLITLVLGGLALLRRRS